MLWVPVTLLATLAQTGRNAAQAGLTRQIGTLGATQVRFLFGLPFALVFLALVVGFGAGAPPVPGLRSLGFTLIGALAQIGATALMLVTMKSQSFAVTTAWLKTEPVLVALIAWAVLGEAPSGPALAATLLATAGVLVMTVKPGARLVAFGPALTGLAAAGLFGLSAIGFRGAITGLESGGELIRATTILVISLALQSAVLGLWMAFLARGALRATFGVWRQSLLAGFLGAFASQLWFLGFALTSAANVRTLALIEVVLAQGVSVLLLGQRVSLRQGAGMVMIVAGVAGLLRFHA